MLMLMLMQMLAMYIVKGLCKRDAEVSLQAHMASARKINTGG